MTSPYASKRAKDMHEFKAFLWEIKERENIRRLGGESYTWLGFEVD